MPQENFLQKADNDPVSNRVFVTAYLVEESQETFGIQCRVAHFRLALEKIDEWERTAGLPSSIAHCMRSSIHSMCFAINAVNN